MKLVNITNKDIKQIRRDMRQFDDDWIMAVGTSFQDKVWRAQRKVFWELTSKLLEAQEEKVGHWIIVDDCEKFIAKCSVCGRIEDSRKIHNYPYCHCGAKMEV